MLKLMYITNQPEIALIAERAGVDRIFIDLEVMDKEKRQGGMDTVQSHHTLQDVCELRSVLTKAELLVRCNHIYEGTQKEIDTIIRNGADIVMLPYFKTANEVRTFVDAVSGRVRTCLLLETPEAVEVLDEILGIDGIDEIHIGLNDLHLGYGMKFMFELLADGTVDLLAAKIRAKGIPFGFGGIASIGQGTLPAEVILKEHYRLGSSMVILSRSFCNTQIIQDQQEVSKIFLHGIEAIREQEKDTIKHLQDTDYFMDNNKIMRKIVEKIVSKV